MSMIERASGTEIREWLNLAFDVANQQGRCKCATCITLRALHTALGRRVTELPGEERPK